MQFLCKPKIAITMQHPARNPTILSPREFKPLVEGTAIIYLSQGKKRRDKRKGAKIMTDDPLYYTEQEFDDLFKERAAFAKRIKAIGKEVQELIASRHKLIAKMGAVADQQAQVAKQAHEVENVDLFLN
jgi:hypothetical protein